MKKLSIMAITSILISSVSFADQNSIADHSQITAEKVSQMCSKMKPTKYSENEEGKVIRKGCTFKNGIYTISYEVSGKQEYIDSLANFGIKNQNAKTGDQTEFNKYCTSYAWLVKTPNLAKQIVVEYKDTSGKLLASKYIETKDCK